MHLATGTNVLLVGIFTLAACAATSPPGSPGASTGSVEAVRRAAKRERAATKSMIVERLDLGALVKGPNRFGVTIMNRTGKTISVGIDLRAEAGLWFRSWQRQFAFTVAGGRRQSIRATYRFFDITPAAVLRVRVGRAEPVAGGLQITDVALDRSYAVGEDNPAARGVKDSFHEFRTEHLDLFVSRAFPADTDIAQIASERENALRMLVALLEIQPQRRIRVVLYADAVSKTRDTGHTGAGLTRGDNIIEIYNPKTRPDPFHELTHVLAGQVGSPPALFSEGLAVYVSERLGRRALDTLGHQGAAIDDVACDLLTSGHSVPLQVLLRYNEIGSKTSAPRVAYPLAASLVKYLVEVEGIARFLEVYGALVNSDQAEQLQRNEGVFAEMVGRSLGEVERGWRQHLGCSPSPGT